MRLEEPMSAQVCLERCECVSWIVEFEHTNTLDGGRATGSLSMPSPCACLNTHLPRSANRRGTRRR